MGNAFKILILDDDKSFSNSLSESLKAHNYELLTCDTSFDAEEQIKTFCPDLLVVDLFMPGGNGSDWVASLLQQAGFNTPVVYISGIFTDLDFQNSLMDHPLILKVLSKPFEVSELLQVINTIIKKNQVIENKNISFYDLECIDQMLISSNYSETHFLKFLNKPTSFLAKNLPQYLNYFFNNASTGFLQIKTEAETAEIHYRQGNIVFIKINDRDSSFGSLLAKLNHFTYEEVEDYCTQAKASSKNIGSFFLEKKLITEEVIFKIINLQIALRLLKLFDLHQISCQWKAQDLNKQMLFGYFSKMAWQSILVRFSKSLELDFLASFAKKFECYYLTLKQDVLPKTISSTKLLSNFSKIQSFLSSNDSTIKNITDKTGPKVLQDLYLLLLLDIVALVDSKQLSIKELININKNNKNKNYFELLNVPTDSAEVNIKQAYRSLSKKFHPDNCSLTSSDEEKKLYEEIFDSISQAYATLSKNKIRESYQGVLEQEVFEEQFKGQLLESKIISQLQEQSIINILPKINSPYIMYGKKQVFLLWALVLAFRAEKSLATQEAIKEKMKVYLKNIPDDIAQFGHFIYFTKALYCETVGDLEEAKYFFSKIKDTESMNITQKISNIDALLVQKQNIRSKKRDIKFGAVVFVLVAAVVSFKLSQNSESVITPVINVAPVAKALKVDKAKRTLSSVEKRNQISGYFAGLDHFALNLFKDKKTYKFVSLQHHTSDKLNILIYKQFLPRSKRLTEENFIQKQNSVKVINSVLQYNSNLEKQYTGLWYGHLTDADNTKIIVHHIKEQNSFIYFVGNFKDVSKLNERIKAILTKL